MNLEPILQINRRIYEENLVEIPGPMVAPLGGFTWNVPKKIKKHENSKSPDFWWTQNIKKKLLKN
jgi:hypothetical protein